MREAETSGTPSRAEAVYGRRRGLESLAVAVGLVSNGYLALRAVGMGLVGTRDITRFWTEQFLTAAVIGALCGSILVRAPRTMVAVTGLPLAFPFALFTLGMLEKFHNFPGNLKGPIFALLCVIVYGLVAFAPRLLRTWWRRRG